MTARQVFEATLIELSKILAPTLKLYEFNYLFNKAINQYINKVYNVYDINQLTTDDLRVLKSTCFLTPKKVQLAKGDANKDSAIQNINADNKGGHTSIGGDPTANPPVAATTTYSGLAQSYLSKAHSSIQSLHGATYEVYLPIDYLHMLNCVCIYYVAKTKDCWDEGSYIEVPAIRLTADSWSQIVTDIYNRPSPMRPYYYIHNMAQLQILPTDPVVANTNVPTGYAGTDIAGTYQVTSYDQSGVATDKAPGSNFQRTFKLNGTTEVSLVEKPIAARIGNTSNVRCEIRYGKDDSLFQLAEVQVDYVKVPQHIRLTQEQIDLTEDTSQIMEFPDYVNQEIINELVHLVMERASDPRTGTHALITTSVARPTGQQQQTQQAQLG